MLQINQITNLLCKERLQSVLRERIGIKRKWSLNAAADDLDIDRRTLENNTQGESLPQLPVFLRMCALFGPEFANRFLHLAGLGGCRRMDVQEVSDFHLNGTTSAMIGVLGRALEDGFVDHREREDIKRSLMALVSVAQDWLARHDVPEGVAPKNEKEDFLNPRNAQGRLDA